MALNEYVVPDGMPRSVFENKYSRRKDDGTLQSYAERAREMVAGNFLMDPRPEAEYRAELELTTALAVGGIFPASGRHLQHGDMDQPNRLMELHTNCSTAMFSFMLFRLLLRGSGVGRDYTAKCCRVNWDNMPHIRLVLDDAHPDFPKGADSGWLEALRDARHKYDPESEFVRWFTVGDSREGWAKIIEILETAAFQEKHRDKLFIFDFSEVRPEGSPIAGLQGRPASGPIALMQALARVYSIRGAGMKPWKQALFIDHYLAACVVWGGARRCMPAGTLVTTTAGAVAIEQLQVGSTVVTPAGTAKVSAVFHQGVQPTVYINHQFGRLECTANHQVAVFDTLNTWTFKRADELKEDDRLVFAGAWEEAWSIGGEATVQPVAVLSVVPSERFVDTWDIEVEDIHQFTANGFVVHNSARMAVKDWRDRDVIEFIDIKRGGFLWSANNSLLVTQDFWTDAKSPRHSHARRVFEAAVNAAYHDATGEPGFINIDLCNTNKEGMDQITGSNMIDPTVYDDLHPRTQDMIENVLSHVKTLSLPFLTNPCFDESTLIVTQKGAFPIRDLVGKTVRVYDGNRWIDIDTFRVTGRDQPMLRINLQDGSHIRVTPEHTMLLESFERVKAKDLAEGSRLLLHEVRYEGTAVEKGAYLKGFLIGDGCLADAYKPLLWLYDTKYMCEDALLQSGAELPVGRVNTNAKVELNFVDASSGRSKRKNMQGLSVRGDDLRDWCGAFKMGLPSRVFQWNLETKQKFIAGLFDADGTITNGKNGFGYQVSSIYRNFLLDLQTLLRSMGIRSKVAMAKKAARKAMPGGVYDTQTCWRLHLGQDQSVEFAKQVPLIRLPSFADRYLSYNVKPRNGIVVSVEHDGVDDTVYCCTVPDSHSIALANGVITGQCGEIILSTWGAYCCIGDINLSRVTHMQQAMDATEQMSRFLVRVNRMNSEYSAEVRRTNRIGVSLTGIHEFAWTMFGLTFYDMISYYDVLDTDAAQTHKAHRFWQSIRLLRRSAETGAEDFSRQLGMVTPHTVTTVKPSGTVSKVMNCTEGAHLPALAYYLRWVQFKVGDPDIEILMARGYPMKDIGHRYSGHVAIGFPTKQPIVDLMGDKVVTADQTSPEDNFKWLRLLEHHWLGPQPGQNNQISYTLKYDSNKVSYEDFMAMILEWQPQVRCCSVMPSSDWRESEKVYGYVPEQPISAEEYDTYMAAIKPVEREAYDDEALMCEGGACPIEFDVNK